MFKTIIGFLPKLFVMRQNVVDEAFCKFNDLGFWVIEIGPAGHDESVDAEFGQFVKSIDAVRWRPVYPELMGEFTGDQTRVMLTMLLHVICRMDF